MHAYAVCDGESWQSDRQPGCRALDPQPPRTIDLSLPDTSSLPHPYRSFANFNLI